MRRTKAQAAETRDQILASAEILFLEEGYESVSLEKIAVHAGVTRGAVHWHFKNKQGLLAALEHEAQQPFIRLADRLAQETTADPLKLLEELVDEMFQNLHSNPRLAGIIRTVMRLDIALADTNSTEGGIFRREVHNSLRRIFHSVEEQNRLPEGWSAASAASVFTAALVGMVGEWALGRTDFNLVPDGRNFVRMILRSWQGQN